MEGGRFSLLACIFLQAPGVCRTLCDYVTYVLKTMVLPIFMLMKDILPLPPPKGRKSVRRAAGTMATHMPPHHGLMHHCVTIFWPFKDLCCVSARQQNAFRRVGAPQTLGNKCAPPSITDPLTLDTLIFFGSFFFSTTMGARLTGTVFACRSLSFQGIGCRQNVVEEHSPCVETSSGAIACAH